MDTTTLFMNGSSQAVRLPKKYRMSGVKARIHKEGKRVILEPIEDDWCNFKTALNSFSSDFMVNGREQPLPPKREQL
jgi:antitoxin VapB